MTTTNAFLNQIVMKVDFMWQPAQWLDWEEAPKHFPRPNLHHKKAWSLFGGLLLVWFTAAFWILAKPLHLRSKAQQINETHQKLQCLKLAMINRKGPIFLHDSAQPHITQSTVQTLNKLGYEVLPHLPYSPNLMPTDYHFFKHLNDFLQGKCLHNQQEAENAVQESTECWSIYFYVTGINVFISHWQECVDCSGFYFD